MKQNPLNTLIIIAVLTKVSLQATGTVCDSLSQASLFCQTCNSNGAFGCDVCYIGYFSNRAATGTDDTSTYASCLPCDENCKVCDRNAQTASAYNACSEAKIGFYLDSTNSEVRKCHNFCKDCLTNPSQTDSYSACTVVKDGYFKETTNKNIYKCPIGCTSCTSSISFLQGCTASKPGYAIDNTNKEVKKCFPGCLQCVDDTFYCTEGQCDTGLTLTNDNKTCQKAIEGCVEGKLRADGTCSKCAKQGQLPSIDGKECVDRAPDETGIPVEEIEGNMSKILIIPFMGLLSLILIL